MYYGLNFEGAKSYKCVILSSSKGLIRSYFQSPKKRGHPVDFFLSVECGLSDRQKRPMRQERVTLKVMEKHIFFKES